MLLLGNTFIFSYVALFLYLFICRWFGSCHDQTVFNFSQIKARFENGEFANSVIIGDNGYGCKNYLITPFRQPRTPAEIRFNKALKTTRSSIERCFGRMKRRFPVLSIASQVALPRTLTNIVAVAVLHNIAINLNEPLPPLIEVGLPNLPRLRTAVPNRIEAMTNESRRNNIVAEYFL